MKFNLNGRLLSILILTGIFLLSGCLFQDEGKQDNMGFVGGDKGLKVSFLDLPPEIFQDVEFDIELVLDNKGEDDIEKGEVYVTLNNANSFNIPAESQTLRNKELLRGTVDIEGTGDREFIKFPKAKYMAPILTPESPVPLSVDVCYPYRTTAVTDICVAKMGESEICVPKEEKDVVNSGAPVKVTKVEQLLSLYTGQQARVGVLIEVETKDKGSYYGSDDGCQALKNSGVISLHSIAIGNEEWVVDPDDQGKGSIQLKKSCGTLDFKLDEEGKGRIQCNLPVHYMLNQGDYVERMTIKLDYVHSMNVNDEIQVIPVS